MRLFKMKFGEEQGHALETCMSQLDEHGPSLLAKSKMNAKQVGPSTTNPLVMSARESYYLGYWGFRMLGKSINQLVQ